MGTSSFRFFTATLFAVSLALVDGMHFGIQSDDGDIASSFASSIVFDAEKKRVYVTGSTFGGFFDPGGERYREKSDCFFALIQLPTRPGDTDPVWLRRMTIGDKDVTEACSSMHADVNGGNIQSLHLVGHSDSPEEEIAVAGVIIDVSWFDGVHGGYQIRSNQVQYPMFIRALPETSDLFVASMASDSTDARVASISEQVVFQDNTSIPIGDFSILVHRIQRYQGTRDRSLILGLQDISRSQIWAERIVSDSMLRLSGMTLLDGGRLLIICMESDPEDSTKYHAFLAILNTSTGEVMRSKRIEDLVQGGSDPGLGLCRLGHPQDKSLYIAGSTIFQRASSSSSTSLGSSQAFLMKISTETLEREWVSYLGAVSNADGGGVNGKACSVTMDGSLVYLGGNVQAGSVVSLDGEDPVIGESLGGIDIFVSQLQANDGALMYARQIGSEQDDVLAGGDGMACDQDGNAIVLGNTKGSMFRHKKPIGEGLANDVVVFTVDRTGRIGKIPGDVVPNAPIDPPDDQDSIFYPDENGPLFDDATLKSEPTVETVSTTSRAGYIVGCVLVANLLLFSSVLLLLLRREKRREYFWYRNFLGTLMLQRDAYDDEDSIIVSNSDSNRDRNRKGDCFGGEESATGDAYMVDDHRDFQQGTPFSSPQLPAPRPNHDDTCPRSLANESGYDENSSPSYYGQNDVCILKQHGYCSPVDDSYCKENEPGYNDGVDGGILHDFSTRPHRD